MQFIADIAGMLEIAAIAAGLLLLHRARRDPEAGLVRAAGAILLAGGILVGLCTTYFWVRYLRQGDFDVAGGHPAVMRMEHPMHGSMHGAGGPGGMGGMPHGAAGHGGARGGAP